LSVGDFVHILIKKRNENRDVARHCRSSGNFHPGASRAYYAVHQTLMKILTDKGYDTLPKFKMLAPQATKPFQHDSMKVAMVTLLRGKDHGLDRDARKRLENALYYVDELKQMRVRGDYDTGTVGASDLDKVLGYMDDILPMLDEVK